MLYASQLDLGMAPMRDRHHVPPIPPTLEAATARYAARDRFTFPGEPAASPLQRYIQNACDPQNFEPNLALCLEISDLINSKKGNAPREAAVAIVNYVNHRNQNVSLLALSLLDICVKNCGYPFHLQISTKEFLNELVRRFPERPPVRPTRTMNRILELIEEWRSTICQTSKHKEDLGFIRDMHRLLSYKGYVFPEVRREDAAVLNPSDNLKSAEEMEEEEKSAQSAKLQELIRRGTPRDLQEANKLMKVMAGYDQRNKTDYRAKAAEEVGRVQQKARILEEMLQGLKPGDPVNEGDVFEELANALASAHPKIQKMCEEESDDHEAVAKLLEINDSIHRTIERYRLVKKGDIAGAEKIPKGTLGVTGAGVKQGPGNELSLIDFGGIDEEQQQQTAAESSSSQAATPAKKGNALEDDLLGLSIGGDTPFGQGGGISLGTSSNGMMGMMTAPQQSASQSFSQPPQQSKPNYDLFSTINVAQSPKPATPQPNPAFAPPTAPSASDPFAALSAGNSRTASPFQFQQSTHPAPAQQSTSSSTLLGGLASNNAAPAPAAADDEWTFTSSLPQEQPHRITVTNSSIRTDFTASRPQGADDWIQIESSTSNNSDKPVGDFTFQLAVTKGFTLKLDPQSSRTLAPKQKDGITQTIRLHGVARGSGKGVKMRWKASYALGGERKEEAGEIASLGVS
ncbi:VHS-domain-containing protein [Myriangium duriaei CBS 260.36]|uniref:VHS-domain-containing protein n=1 Tax=Myriangium duriaei CBS 260.36 TaxID=1168546 RepID=A0A9P4J487_9PEZI|nr:VHS-domain-containing protein [Myriangium duriaei CBS 260.36]